MKKRTYGIALSLLLPLAANASPYKCVQPDGSVTFQQIACPETADESVVEIHQGPSAAPGYSPSTDRYSVTNQVERMKAEKAQKSLERSRRSSSSPTYVTRPKEKDSSCGWYKNRLEKAKSELRRGYTSQRDKIDKQGDVEWWKGRVQRHCK